MHRCTAGLQTGSATAQAVSCLPVTAETRFDPRSDRVRAMVDKVALGGGFPRHLRAKSVHLPKSHALSESFGKKSTVEPGYNDIGLCDTSTIPSDIPWYLSVRHC